MVLHGLAVSSVSGRSWWNLGRTGSLLSVSDTNPRGDTTLRFPFTYESTLPGEGQSSPLFLKNPSNIKNEC